LADDVLEVAQDNAARKLQEHRVEERVVDKIVKETDVQSAEA
jgi:hypothetical protein